jgi:hypothetical protein
MSHITQIEKPIMVWDWEFGSVRTNIIAYGRMSHPYFAAILEIKSQTGKKETKEKLADNALEQMDTLGYRNGLRAEVREVWEFGIGCVSKECCVMARKMVKVADEDGIEKWVEE